MSVNANRKWELREDAVKLTVHIPETLAYRIGQAKGDMSRNAWMLEAFREKLERDGEQG